MIKVNGFEIYRGIAGDWVVAKDRKIYLYRPTKQLAEKSARKLRL